jgi:hypothetical protein
LVIPSFILTGTSFTALFEPLGDVRIDLGVSNGLPGSTPIFLSRSSAVASAA